MHIDLTAKSCELFRRKRLTADVLQGPPQPVITCSKLTIETLEQGAEYVQS